ncbi:2494_t:CDS:2, partial [Acaulospora morrowiae]
KFGVVIDAGSSGSRVQIYSWKEHSYVRENKNKSDLHRLPTIEFGDEFGLKWQKKVEPGISSFSSNPSQVGESHLKELIDFALEVIPPDEVSETPIYLLATAGMRLLPTSQQDAILQNACDYIMFKSRFKMFERCSDNIQVISGQMEGIYGWVAINYLMGGFEFDKGNHNVVSSRQLDDKKHTTTFGFLDMGGASTQIAFEPSSDEAKKHANDLTTVPMWTLDGQQIEYQVFVTTFLGYGTNEARRRYIEDRIKNYTETHVKITNPESSREQPVILLKDPCLPVDLALTDRTLPPPYYTLQGTGSFEKCLDSTYPLLNKTAECKDEPCLFNGVHTPKIDFSVNHFIGISEYWYTSNDVFGLGGPWDYHEFVEKAKGYCENDWNKIYSDFHEGKWNSSIDLPRLEMQCFKAAWLANVLHEGIGIPKNPSLDKRKGKNAPYFQSINSVGDMQVSWTLGKMVLEASSTIPLLLGPRPRPPPNPQHHGILGYYNFMIEWIIGITLLIVLLAAMWWLCVKRNGPWKGRRISTGFMYSFLLSMIRKDNEPEYNRLDGGQYVPSITIRRRIINMLDTFSRAFIYIKWKITHKISFPFRRAFVKKVIIPNDDASVQVAIMDDVEEMVHVRTSPIKENSLVVNIQDIPPSPITEKGSPTEQYFPSQRYISKKRLSGDSAIQGGSFEMINKAFSTPVNLSLTGLQSRNGSVTSLGKTKTINTSNVSLGGVQTGANNIGGYPGGNSEGGTIKNTVVSLNNGTANYPLRNSRSISSLNPGWVLESIEDNNEDELGVVEYEAADLTSLGQTATLSSRSSQNGSSSSSPTKVDDTTSWYSTSTSTRPFSSINTSPRNSILLPVSTQATGLTNSPNVETTMSLPNSSGSVGLNRIGRTSSPDKITNTKGQGGIQNLE